MGVHAGNGLVNGSVVLSGYAPSFTSACNASAVIAGELAKAKSSVLAFSPFSNGRPGYVPMVPPHDGSWQANKGAGIIPWNNPNPARTTTLRLVPTLYATPRRGSIFFHCVFSTFEGQVSHSQRRPALSVSLL